MKHTDTVSCFFSNLFRLDRGRGDALYGVLQSKVSTIPGTYYATFFYEDAYKTCWYSNDDQIQKLVQGMSPQYKFLIDNSADAAW